MVMSDADVEAVNSLLSLQTALGAGVLEPVSFRTEELISAPYAVTVEVTSEKAAINPDDVLFQPACLTVKPGTAAPRIFQGLVRSFVASGQPVRDRYSYTLIFVPKLWFMQQTRDCRIFTGKSVADIVSMICSEAGQTININVSGDKPVKPYVTQFNETDFTFVSRLMEEAGYFYYFTFTAGDHTLIVANQNQGFLASPKPTMTVSHEGGGKDVLTAWQKVAATTIGSFHIRDYDLTQPDTPPDATETTKLGTAGATVRDVFEWPALALTQTDASARARIKMEAAEAVAALIEAQGEDPGLMPGSRLTVKQDPFTDAEGLEYIIRGVISSGRDETWVTGAGGANYTNHIVAFPAKTPWRQPLVTPRPVMAGIHSAVVIGSSGEEIHSEQYGRVKIRFFWDHRKDVTADNGVWVRVIQPWAGNTWGWQSLPRVGCEVAVAFFDGDPDRPVIVGGLYNADMMPVFPIAAEQTKSGLRSRSSTGGGSETFSEFSIDDKAGSERVFLHAEKDMVTEIENNETITVNNAQTITVKAGRTTTVNAKGDSLTVENGGIKVTAQNSDIAIEASTGNITVQALNSIKLTVGGNSIEINAEGVTINAMKVSVQGQAMVQVQAPMTQVSGDGMLTMKGGLVQLN
jgi:type VI secretion system secreted protein VgrG